MTARVSYVVTPRDGAPYRVTLDRRGDGWSAEVERGDERWSFQLATGPGPGLARAGTRGVRWRRDPAAGTIRVNGREHALLVESEAAHRAASSAARPAAAHGAREVRAPMPGLVVATLVGEEGEVTAGQGVLVIEAMKMENEISAPVTGVVRGIAVRSGQAVEKGAVLFRVEAAPGDEAP